MKFMIGRIFKNFDFKLNPVDFEKSKGKLQKELENGIRLVVRFLKRNAPGGEKLFDLLHKINVSRAKKNIKLNQIQGSQRVSTQYP